MAVEKKYAQVRTNGNVVCLVGDESLGMPITDSDVVYTINLMNHAQQNEVQEGMIYNKTKGIFEWGDVTYAEEYNPYSKTVRAVLKADGWEGDSVPYTQTVSVNGIGSKTAGVVGISETATDAEYRAATNAFLRKVAQDDCSLTIVAYEDKPTIDIPIVIKIS